MRLFRPCFLAGWLFPEAIFRIKTSDNILCLTFDDGPDPESTPQLLEILDKHQVRAIFFCSGEAAEKYPHLADMIKSKGHLKGNHTYSHLNGCLTSAARYCGDVNRAADFTSCRLFRPPYGCMRLSQYRIIKRDYRIVMWDVMPYDFDARFGSQRSLAILKEKIRPGSIIVLHDTATGSACDFLDDFIHFAKELKYRFCLPDFK